MSWKISRQRRRWDLQIQLIGWSFTEGERPSFDWFYLEINVYSNFSQRNSSAVSSTISRTSAIGKRKIGTSTRATSQFRSKWADGKHWFNCPLIHCCLGLSHILLISTSGFINSSKASFLSLSLLSVSTPQHFVFIAKNFGFTSYFYHHFVLPFLFFFFCRSMVEVEKENPWNWIFFLFFVFFLVFIISQKVSLWCSNHWSLERET